MAILLRWLRRPSRQTVRTAAGALLAGLLMSVAVLGLVTVHNTGSTVRNTGAAVAGIRQIQKANIAAQSAKDAAMAARVAELQAQVAALEEDIQADTVSIAGLTGSNGQLARALEADIAELRALGLRPVIEVPAAPPAAKAPTTTTVPEKAPTATTVLPKTTTTTTCNGLARLLGGCR